MCETAAVPRRTVLLVLTLAKAAEVDVFCWSRLGTSQVPAELHGRVELSRGHSLRSFLTETAERVRSGSYQGVVAADLRLLTWVILCACGSGLRVVYDRMEIPTLALAERLRRWLRLRPSLALQVAQRLERIVVARASAVLTVPVRGVARRHVRALHATVHTIHNWPAVTEVAPPKEATAIVEPFTVVYTGAIGPATGLDLLLEAAYRLHADGGSFRLVLVGYFVGVSAREVVAAVFGLGLTEIVDVRPRVPFAELAAVMRRAHVGVALLDPGDAKFRYVAPGMSRKVFTYMAAGLAVVAGGPGSAWVEGERIGLSVPYGDAVALAQALRTLRDDDVLRDGMGAMGRQAVANRYHWEVQEDVILDAVLGRDR